MLGLRLRPEFAAKHLKGTTIQLVTDDNKGAIHQPASDFFKITYPTADLLKAMDAVAADDGHPIVLKGERGQGKSHLLAAIHHALVSPEATHDWLTSWGHKLNQPRLSEIRFKSGMHVITASLQQQKFKHLWDLIFARHPRGEYVRGAWENQGSQKTDVPGTDLIQTLIDYTPTVLILDEFQTWYDGLINTKQSPNQRWAFNFIQILSELAQEQPQKFKLIVSVRNGDTESFQQIHRNHPVTIDFMQTNHGSDRLRLLLHRLFENHSNLPVSQIQELLKIRVGEMIRLKDLPGSEFEALLHQETMAWPFSLDLFRLLEDEVLKATSAQETRDLIRVLAGIYKSHGEKNAVLTPADIRIDEDDSVVVALLDSISNTYHERLREKARRNLDAVKQAHPRPDQDVPHNAELISSLWIRSLSINNPGATPSQLQIDLTRERKIDDNFFAVELERIAEHSFNIHRDKHRFYFKEEENPQAKLIANSKNDKLFQDGSDKKALADILRAMIQGFDGSQAWRVVLLLSDWQHNPWVDILEEDKPENWRESVPLIVIPEGIPTSKVGGILGSWIKTHLSKRRNRIRFLLPGEGNENVYRDRAILLLARQYALARDWESREPVYSKQRKKSKDEIEALMKTRFSRFAVLDAWDYQNPTASKYHIENHGAEGSRIPASIDKVIRESLFIPEDFEAFVVSASHADKSIAAILEELQEPRPAGETCIPWIGESEILDKILKLCARGKIAINIQGMGLLQAHPGEEDEKAWQRMRSKLPSGRQLQNTFIGRPQPQAAPAAPPPTPEPPPQTHNPSPFALPGETSRDEKPLGINGTSQVLSPVCRAEKTTAINLLGRLEAWGIQNQSALQSLRLRCDKLSGEQLKALVSKLPPGLTFDLEIDKA